MFVIVLASVAAFYAITCPPGEEDVNGKCYPSGCVFDNTVCNNRGTCTNSICQCDAGNSLGAQGCYPSACYRGSWRLCNGHGECVEKEPNVYQCNCDKYYIEAYDMCVPEACYTDEGMCSGYGTCIQPTDGTEPYCKCFPANAGDKCADCSSEAINVDGECIHKDCLTEFVPGEILICNGMGRCTPSISTDGVYYTCSCYPFNAKFYNGTCISNSCITKVNQYGVIEVCSDNGICANQRCVCDEHYNGHTCEYRIVDCAPGFISSHESCYPKECVKDGIVCGDAGRCIWNSEGAACLCNDGYAFFESSCVYASCIVNGVLCPHGTYNTSRDVPFCSCPNGYSKHDNVCYPSSCITATSKYSPPQLCNNAGACDFDTGVCTCYPTNTGPTCTECSLEAVLLNGICTHWSCVDDTDPDNLSLCSGHGQCFTQVGSSMLDVCYYCRCDSGYYDVPMGRCIPKSCMSSRNIICNNRGRCFDRTCQCNEGYSGPYCESYQCPVDQTFVNNICVSNACITHYDDSNNTLSVCGGYGKCIQENNKYECTCRANAIHIDGECVSPSCITNTETNEICNGHGKCNGYDCVCSKGYKGKKCNKKAL